MKTVMLLYLFLFVAFFDLHAQSPILSPFALSLGATPAFIGVLMGVYACTHIPGQWFAGRLIDQYGSRLFIAASLTFAGLLLLAQAFVSAPWQLLVLRGLSGFVLAFLSPACLAMLARVGRSEREHGNLMSGNGFVQMAASIAAPGLGALCVAAYGFRPSFLALGAALVATGVAALLFLPREIRHQDRSIGAPERRLTGALAPATSIPYRLLTLPLALAFSQAVIYYELPLREQASTASAMLHTGLDFAWISGGAALTLSFLFLNRFSPLPRAVVAGLALAFCCYGLALEETSSSKLVFTAVLVLIGMSKGIIYPALATLVATSSKADSYGKMFASLAISYSIGAFFGPLVAGMTRDIISPYFITCMLLLGALATYSPFTNRFSIKTVHD